MNTFNELVSQALENNPDYATLQIVVEKELLHHDILRILSKHHFLNNLTFIGGTCLRACYKAPRLSEDLDFTGGKSFSKETLSDIKRILEHELYKKYGFTTTVSEPTREETNVSTWKIKIITRPEKKHLPTQRINLDICSVESYESQPLTLINVYGVNMGTSGLIIQSQTKEEIFSDKLIAVANRPNRLKYRDLWDILWLHQQGISPKYSLIPKKLAERHIEISDFLKNFQERVGIIQLDKNTQNDFKKELSRFLPVSSQEIIHKKEFWPMLTNLLLSLLTDLKAL